MHLFACDQQATTQQGLHWEAWYPQICKEGFYTSHVWAAADSKYAWSFSKKRVRHDTAHPVHKKKACGISMYSCHMSGGGHN